MLSSKFLGQRAENDSVLSSGRSQSGGVKDKTASPYSAFRQGAKSSWEHQRQSHNEGELGHGFGVRAGVLQSEKRGKPPLTEAPWSIREKESTMCREVN